MHWIESTHQLNWINFQGYFWLHVRLNVCIKFLFHSKLKCDTLKCLYLVLGSPLYYEKAVDYSGQAQRKSFLTKSHPKTNMSYSQETNCCLFVCLFTLVFLLTLHVFIMSVCLSFNITFGLDFCILLPLFLNFLLDWILFFQIYSNPSLQLIKKSYVEKILVLKLFSLIIVIDTN